MTDLISSICQSPKVSSSSHSTTDAFFHQNTAFIAEMTIKCQNDVKYLNLHAEINGRLFPVAQVPNTNNYVVSWTEAHSRAAAASYEIKIFDEDQVAAFRKAIRNNEDLKSLKSLTIVSLKHPGLSKGQFVSSETIALAMSAIVLYFAYSWKSALMT
uniref:Translocon-associated protein subunit delta n=1 Tax=Romanomermis culicivorax TaxID=13658 RepID=A0A915I5F0_ROMCU